MYQPEGRKYQLFPKGSPAATAKGLDPEQAFAHAISRSQSKSEKSDKLSSATNGLRLRIKEHNLNRRRKISVPELGPMTTVQEAAMDSRKWGDAAEASRAPANIVQRPSPDGLPSTSAPSAPPAPAGSSIT